jgi:RimK family alpha-L-glutamate ligase
VDKFYTSALLEAAGLPTPRTAVAERMDDAMTAFRALRDVIVKPLFGSGGYGMVRVSDEEIAYRVFRALELERAVYYLQEAMPHEGRDLRAFVVGDRVVAAAWRCAEGWRTNVAQGARVERASLPADWRDLSIRAARAVTAEYAGVDLLPLADGRVFVLEVNSIPGWQGLQSVTEVNVAAAIVAHLEAVARRP